MGFPNESELEADQSEKGPIPAENLIDDAFPHPPTAAVGNTGNPQARLEAELGRGTGTTPTRIGPIPAEPGFTAVPARGSKSVLKPGPTPELIPIPDPGMNGGQGPEIGPQYLPGQFNPPAGGRDATAQSYRDKWNANSRIRPEPGNNQPQGRDPEAQSYRDKWNSNSKIRPDAGNNQPQGRDPEAQSYRDMWKERGKQRPDAGNNQPQGRDPEAQSYRDMWKDRSKQRPDAGNNQPQGRDPEAQKYRDMWKDRSKQRPGGVEQLEEWQAPAQRLEPQQKGPQQRTDAGQQPFVPKDKSDIPQPSYVQQGSDRETMLLMGRMERSMDFLKDKNIYTKINMTLDSRYDNSGLGVSLVLKDLYGVEVRESSAGLQQILDSAKLPGANGQNAWTKINSSDLDKNTSQGSTDLQPGDIIMYKGKGNLPSVAAIYLGEDKTGAAKIFYVRENTGIITVAPINQFTPRQFSEINVYRRSDIGTVPNTAFDKLLNGTERTAGQGGRASLRPVDSIIEISQGERRQKGPLYNFDAPLKDDSNEAYLREQERLRQSGGKPNYFKAPGDQKNGNSQQQPQRHGRKFFGLDLPF